jgi:hypothetical protein
MRPERKGIKRAAIIGSALITLTMLGTPAQATTSRCDAGQGSVSIMSNECNYPTSARPGSTYVESWGNCRTCRSQEIRYEVTTPFWRDYYCTYNPRTDMNDLHYI